MTALLYDLLYGVPLCLIAILSMFRMLGAPEQAAFSLLVGGVSIGVCACIKYWESRLRFLLPGVILAAASGILLMQPVQNRLAFLLGCRWILWVFLLTTGIFLLGRFVAEMKWLRRLLCVAFLGDLLVAMFRQVFPDKAATALELFFLLLCIAEEVQATWEKSGYTDRKGHLVSIAPFLLVLGLSVFALPAPEKAFDWEFAVQIWRHAVEEIKLTNRFFHRRTEDYATMGFAESGDFWGNLQKKDKTVMEITGRADPGNVIYLPGRIQNAFDGRTWSDAFSQAGRDRELDTLETLCAVYQQEPEYLQNYLWRVDIKCQYDEFNTKYLFIPLKPLLKADRIDEISFLRQGADLVSEKTLGFGTEYSVGYFRLNQGHEEVKALLKNPPPISADTWGEIRARYDANDAGTSFAEYQQYQERIYREYLPDTPVSPALSEYLEQLMEGAGSDYERMERLEKMLSSYRYSLSPGKLPEKVNSPAAFLDYFLLESREGYCSHFATAFVLLARNQGLPARYVQGYYVKKEKSGTVTVSTDMAHAWPEVYFKDFGWVAFEPTPGFKRTARWEFRKKQTVDGRTEYVEELWEEEEETEVILPEAEEEKSTVKWYLLLLPLGFGLLFMIVFFLADLAIAKRWYERLEQKEKFQVTLWRNLRILALLGWTRGQGETLEEFRNRVLEGMQGKKQEEALQTPVEKVTHGEEKLAFLEDFEEVIYGACAIDADMNQRAKESYENLLRMLRDEKGKAYWWHYFMIISRKKTELGETYLTKGITTHIL